jgi:putative DNA primase/helicase
MTEPSRKRPTFEEVKRASLGAIDTVLTRWLPGGKRVDGGKEYTAPNPNRTDKHDGSLKVNLAKGVWSDFATGDAGSDLIDLVAYLDRCGLLDACNSLADFLNMGDASAAPAGATEAKPKPVGWKAVTPIPEQALASRPAKHFKYGKPATVWTYRDTGGQPVLYVCRFNLKSSEDGRAKVYAPLTWCESASGKREWRWQSLPPSRPLYNLDQLASKPAAPVVLCEGEKAADAAAGLLPEYVATCWPNGASGWKQADFACLQGRDVLLWPDNDAPGLKCMDAIARHLNELGAASVKVINLEAFNQTPAMSKGKPSFAAARAWPDGADAADAQAAGWTPAHLAKLAESGELIASAHRPGSVSKSTKARAKKSGDGDGQVRGGFKVRPDGVFFVGEDGDARPVCSPLEILARTRDAGGHNWGLLVQFDDPDGASKRWNIPARAMASDFGKDVLGPLVDMGLRLALNRPNRHARNDLQTYLQGFDSPARARLVTRLGWHEGAYLLPEKQIGESRERLHFYEAGVQLPPITEAGTLDQWRQKVAAFCVGNHRLAFAVSMAFAGPLLKILGQESGGFHFYGDSSGGKTTHSRAAASVWGGSRLLRSWRSTDNGMEGIAASHSDGLLVLDEIGLCEPRIIGETIYMLGNGVGKVRATDRGQTGRPVQEWLLLFLSNGEKTLSQHMAEAGKELKAGMEVRMLAIPADAGKGFGMFDEIHGFSEASVFADSITASAGRYFGTPIVAFLQNLTKQELAPFAVVLRRSVEAFVAETLPANSSGQAHRAATRFGLVAAGGELATEYGITGWPEGFATEAAKVCLRAWLAERGGAGNLEGDKIVERLKLVIERDGEARFTRWENIAASVDEHAPRTMNRLGFRRTVTHGGGDAKYSESTFYFLTTAWRDEVFKGHNLANVNKELVRRGILQPAKDKAAQSINLPGMGKTRAYVVSNEKLMADQDETAAEAA